MPAERDRQSCFSEQFLIARKYDPVTPPGVWLFVQGGIGRGQILGPDVIERERRGLAQYHIPAVVAVGIVGAFEMVKVNHRKPETLRCPAPPCAADLAVQRLPR